MAVKTTGGSRENDIDQFIERMHEIRMEERKARAKRLESSGSVGKAVSSKTSGKQIGYSFKSGQGDAINNRFNYSSMDNENMSIIKTGKSKK